jgi:hypothetical protein
MARKSPKDLSLLKQGLIKSCLGKDPKASRKREEVEDEDDPPPVRTKKPLGHAASVTPQR